MKESVEKIIKVGFKRKPKEIFDEIESTIEAMTRDRWVLKENCAEEGMAAVHLFFEREIVN
jgi:hypothetical protein